MAKPMLPDAVTRANAVARLPLNIAVRLLSFLNEGDSGSFILHIQNGVIRGARVEVVVKT